MKEKPACPQCGCTQVFLQLEQDYVCNRVQANEYADAVPQDEPRLFRANCNGCQAEIPEARIVVALPNGTRIRRRFLYTSD